MANHPDFNKFFAPGGAAMPGVHLLCAGKVSVPGGQLITADPLVGLDRGARPLVPEVPVGQYEVTVCILSDSPDRSYGDYAAARVCFTDSPAVCFEEASVAGETREEGVSYGFPVDTGLACFCDARVRDALCDFEDRLLQEHPDGDLYNDYLADLLAENARRHPAFQSPGGDWLDFCIPGTDYHLPIFRSGYGDGCYTTYWGRDAAGNICQAVIGFMDMEEAYGEVLRRYERRTFRPDGLCPDGAGRMARRVQALRELVRQHPTGHLPLAERVAFYRHTGHPATVQKILYECCKKAYPLWERYVCREQCFLRLLRAAGELLYRPGSNPEAGRHRLVKEADRLTNYAHYYGSNPRSIAAYAVVKLCYSLLCRAEDVLKWEEDYRGEDDMDETYSDPESLTPDFIAEMAWVGQPGDGDDVGVQRRREYWLWFLDMAEALCRCPVREYLPLAEPVPEPRKTVFTRRQSCMDGPYPLRPLGCMTDRLRDYLRGTGWERAEVLASILTGALVRLTVERGGERLEVDAPDFLYTQARELRKIMYARCPAEGAWLECTLTVTPGGEYTVSFNYDDKEAMREDWNPDRFAATFEEFPRSCLYTPAWWQNLLSYDTEYLLSDGEKAAAIGLELAGGVLCLGGTPLEFPLSADTLVRRLGEERLAKGYRPGEDYDGAAVEYDPVSFLVWDEAGMFASRDEENPYRVAALCVQLAPRPEAGPSVPLPAKLFNGRFTVGGKPFRYEDDTFFRCGDFEVTVTGGYAEIVRSVARCRCESSHYYRNVMQENRHLAHNDREHISVLEKAEARGREYHPGTSNKKLLLQVSKDYLTHALAALTAGYALGRSGRFLRAILLPPLLEAAAKRCDYRRLPPGFLLPVASALVLLRPDPRDLEKFAACLREHATRDFVTDTLLRHCLPAWELTDTTAFPELKALLLRYPQDVAAGSALDLTAEPVLADPLVRDALLAVLPAAK